MAAAECGHLNVINALISAKANPNLKNTVSYHEY
jgi:ankyrin repeat protein